MYTPWQTYCRTGLGHLTCWMTGRSPCCCKSKITGCPSHKVHPEQTGMQANTVTLIGIPPSTCARWTLIAMRVLIIMLTTSWAAESLEKVDRGLGGDVRKEAYQEAAASALQCANESYSPYTRCPAGVAILTDMGVYCGGIVENAAHNPTLQPLQAAFIDARFKGLTDYYIVRSPSSVASY